MDFEKAKNQLKQLCKSEKPIMAHMTHFLVSFVASLSGKSDEASKMAFEEISTFLHDCVTLKIVNQIDFIQLFGTANAPI